MMGCLFEVNGVQSAHVPRMRHRSEAFKSFCAALGGPRKKKKKKHGQGAEFQASINNYIYYGNAWRKDGSFNTRGNKCLIYTYPSSTLKVSMEIVSVSFKENLTGYGVYTL